MTERILILGASGRLGKVAAKAFRDAGWQVVSQVRPGAAARAAPGTEVAEVNLRDYAAVRATAAGAAAALASKRNSPVKDVPFDLVRAQLLAHGAILDGP